MNNYEILKVPKETMEFLRYFTSQYIDPKTKDDSVKALRAIEFFFYAIDREVKKKGKAVITVM